MAKAVKPTSSVAFRLPTPPVVNAAQPVMASEDDRSKFVKPPGAMRGLIFVREDFDDPLVLSTKV